MSQILTYTKKMFDPLRPDTALIDIADIAHSLSMLCRANGHFKTFYSVGQHSINCANEARARGYTRRVQLACLLHDASEAYLSDVTRPVKQEMPRYVEIEKPLQEAIWRKWLGAPLDAREAAQVFGIDDDILEQEFLALMETPLRPVVPELKTRPVFDFMEFSRCEEEFLRIFYQLTAEVQ